MALKWFANVVDSTDPRTLAEFWAAVLDFKIVFADDTNVAIAKDTQTFPGFVFTPVADPKEVKNRMHVDLNPDDQAAEVERLIGLGATRVDIGQGDVPWVVLADPEGNEFCVLTPQPWQP